MNAQVLDAITRAPLVPTIYLSAGAEKILQYGRLLAEGKYPAVEILSRPLGDALAVFRRIASAPERKLLRWGIGTLRTREGARKAVALTPDFLVSPAFSRNVP